MPAERLIAINAAGGAQVVVNASIPCRRVEIIEDESVTPQGLSFQSSKDNFVGTYVVSPSTEPIILQNSMAQGRGASPILGLPIQNSTGQFNSRPADPLFKAVSVAGATKIRVTEDE